MTKMFMLKLAKVFFLILLSFALLSYSNAQQSKSDKSKPAIKDDDDVVRVDTRLVTVHASVVDRDGKFIPDLQKDYFHLYEDGEEQNIAYFETTESPFTVALLLDTSDSTIFKLNEIQNAAIAFVDQLRSDDRVIIFAFDVNVMKMCEATNDRAKLRDAIRRTRTGGGTSLYTMIDTTINDTLRNIQGRKAIILFTDGIDTTSVRATYSNTLDAAKELDAIIYTIQYQTSDYATKRAEKLISTGVSINIVTAKGEPLKVAYERGTRYLRSLANNTGGRFYYADTLSSLTKTFVHIAKELSQQYSLSYYPENQDAKHPNRRIKVTVNFPKAVVKTRRGYVFK